MTVPPLEHSIRIFSVDPHGNKSTIPVRNEEEARTIALSLIRTGHTSIRVSRKPDGQKGYVRVEASD